MLTFPYLVPIVVPSMSGSKSRCTPSADASALRPPNESRALQILSISSIKTIPLSSTARIASFFKSTPSNSLSNSNSKIKSRAIDIGTFFRSMACFLPLCPAAILFHKSVMATTFGLLVSDVTSTLFLSGIPPFGISTSIS